jgi:phage repressor protein C with HTH and peptisase S24 domain
MRKLIVVLLLAIPLAGSARMFPTEFPIKAVCWDNVEEAIEYHQEVLGEYPVGKGWIRDKSFAAIMFNPVKPSWTFLSFHTSEEGIIVCAITGGSMWETIHPGDEAEKLEL